jgi:hypothetical protein
MTDATNKISAKPGDEFETISKYVAWTLWRKAKYETNMAGHARTAVLYHSLQNKLKDSLWVAVDHNIREKNSATRNLVGFAVETLTNAGMQ